MKPRTKYFLSDDKISHDSEQFDYIAELHEYLWAFVRIANPGASGRLRDHVDDALGQLRGLREGNELNVKELTRALKEAAE